MLGRILDGMKPYFGTTSDVAIVTTAGIGRSRGGGRQHALARRPRPRRLDRVVRRPVRQDRRHLRRRRDQARRRMGLGRGPATRSASGSRGMPDAKAVLLTHNETSTGVMNPIAELAAAIRDETPRRAHPRRQRVGPRRRPVRDGRLGRRPRRHRVAEGLDGRAGPGDDRRLASAPGPRWRRRRCRASTSTCAPTATRPSDGQTPFTPAIAVVYQVDEGLRLMTARGQGRDLRPPRGLRGGGPGRPGRARLRALRRPGRTPR